MVTRTYGSLRLTDDNRWEVSNLESHVAIRLKQFFARIPKHQSGSFFLPNDLTHAADIEWFTSRYPLAATDADLATLHGGRLAFEGNQAEMERILQPAHVMPEYVGLKPGCEVRHYQAQAVEVLMRAEGLLVGDEVGLGKTFITAAACLAPGTLPAAIVCKTHLQRQWSTVLKNFTTLRVHEIKGTRPYELPPADVYIFRYSQLAGWVDTYKTMGFKLVAFDEIQELRTGRSTAKGAAAWRLCEYADYRLGLTATPIYNYGGEIWSIMEFLRPDVLGTWIEFQIEWMNHGRVVENPDALGMYLREQYAFLRRTKKDVGQAGDPVNRIVDTIEYDEDSIRSIDDLAHSLAVKATTGEFTERGQAVRELDMLARHHTGLAKAKQVADFARIVVEGGEPIVLVGWHRDVYDIWNERLADLNPLMYTGSESTARKNANKEAFMRGDSKILILSLRSGEGLDGLQFHCSTMIFGELDWSPGVHHQCIGRLDRDGQTEPVTAIFLVVDEGSDPPMMEVLGLKASQASAIVDPTLGVQPVHSDASHMKMLVDRYLKKRGGRHAVAAPAGPAQLELSA